MSGSTAAKLAQMILGVEALKGAKIVGAKLLKSPGLYEVDWKTDKMSFMARVELVDGAPQIRLSTDAIAPGKGLAETVRELLEWTAGEQLRQAKLIREMLGQRPPSEDEQKEQGEGEGEGEDKRRAYTVELEKERDKLKWENKALTRRDDRLHALRTALNAKLYSVGIRLGRSCEDVSEDDCRLVELVGDLANERDQFRHELSKEERQSKEWCDALKGAKAALLVMRADRDSLKACALEPAVCILGPYNPYDHIDSAHRLLTGMGVAVLGTLTDRITSLGGTLKASLSWHRDGCRCPTHAVDDTAGDEDFEDGRPIDVEAAEAAYKVEGVRPVIRAAPVQPEPCTVEHCVTHDRE